MSLEPDGVKEMFRRDLFKVLLAAPFAAMAAAKPEGHSQEELDRMNALMRCQPPIGTIQFLDTRFPVPQGWALCNGTLGTINLMDEFQQRCDLGHSMAAGGHPYPIECHSHRVTISGVVPIQRIA